MAAWPNAACMTRPAAPTAGLAGAADLGLAGGEPLARPGLGAGPQAGHVIP